MAEITEGVFQAPVLLFQTPTTNSETEESDEKPLKVCESTQISPIFREPFILGGYRTVGTSFTDCIRYTCVLHNDVGNFWTHFVPFLIWITWLAYEAKYNIDFTDPYFYPLLCFWVGASSYAFFSSMAHAFSCRSFEVRTVCFTLDYLGIALYALGGGISAFFYQQSVHSPYFSYKYPILFLEASFAVSAVVFGGLTRFFWKKYRFVIRILSFVLPYMSALLPFLQRFLRCIMTGEECVHETLHLHFIGVLLTMTLTFFFVTKIPERFAPGKFDYFFQSHQIFHITAAIQTTMQMYMIPYDGRARRKVLEAVGGTSPDITTTFVPFLTAVVFGLLTAVILGYLMRVGVLTSNKVPAAYPNKDDKKRR